MKPSEASKKLEFHSKQICHGCVHPSMVGWCENHCQLPEAFKMAIFALKKQEADRWISVTKRLPKICKDVLVTDREVSDVYVSYYCGGGYWNTDTGGANNRIIAWRPLPEPYTEEES